METHYTQIYVLQTTMEKFSSFLQENKPFPHLNKSKFLASIYDISEKVLELLEQFPDFSSRMGEGMIRTYQAQNPRKKRKLEPKKVELKKEEKIEPKTEMADDDVDLQRILELSMQTAEEDDARRKQNSQEKKKRRNLAPKFEPDSGVGKSPAKAKQAKKRKALDSSDEESERPNESVKVVISSDDEAPTIRRRVSKPKEPVVFSDIEEEVVSKTKIKEEKDEPDPFELFGSDFDTDNEFNPFEGDETGSSKSEVSEVKSVIAANSTLSKSESSRTAASQEQHPTVILSSDDEMETETRNPARNETSVKRDNVKTFPMFQPPVATTEAKTTEPAPSTSVLNETVTENDLVTYGFNAPIDACELLKERFGYR